MKIRMLFLLSSISLSLFSQGLDEWEGTYTGKLDIHPKKGELKEVQMQLDIQKVNDSIYDWTITYGEDGTDVRKYQLLDKGGNEYLMDEKNSILLNTTKFGNELISVFDVQGSCLWVSYTLTDQGIAVKITSSVKREETGGVDQEDETIPVVGTYTTVVNQSGLLIKKN